MAQVAEKIAKTTFEEFLKENMSAADFENLPALLGESRKYTTMIIRNPAIGNTRHLSVILERLICSCTVAFLMDEFDFGKETISESERQLISK